MALESGDVSWNEHGGGDLFELYTQVDGDLTTDEVFYLKGNHYVNRTGVYALVAKNPRNKIVKSLLRLLKLW